MIFSVGYQKIQPARLVELCDRLDAFIVDVRAKPVSRKPGFGRRQLEALLGERYVWRGDQLGGLPPSWRDGRPLPKATSAGIDWLVTGEHNITTSPRNVILMCQEEFPGDCHRHLTIARALLRESISLAVWHLHEEDVVSSEQLDRALRADEPEVEYEALEPLEWLANAARRDAGQPSTLRDSP